MRKEKAKLKADFALVCDTELFAPNLPTLCVGLRGLVYTEIEANGAKTDLAFWNVWRRGAESFLRADRNHQQAEGFEGQRLIPGFYSKVKAPTQRRIEGMEAASVQ